MEPGDLTDPFFYFFGIKVEVQFKMKDRKHCYSTADVYDLENIKHPSEIPYQENKINVKLRSNYAKQKQIIKLLITKLTCR